MHAKQGGGYGGNSAEPENEEYPTYVSSDTSTSSDEEEPSNEVKDITNLANH